MRLDKHAKSIRSIRDALKKPEKLSPESFEQIRKSLTVIAGDLTKFNNRLADTQRSFRYFF